MKDSALFIYADHPEERNCSYFRVSIPAKYLQLAGHDIRVVHFESISWKDIPETVLIERRVLPDVVQRLRMAGATRIIATFDDDYRNIPPNSPSYGYWKSKFGLFCQALSMVDCAIVPSDALVERYFRHSPNICKVPNFHDDDLFFGLARSEDRPIRIGWGGSSQHSITWALSGCAAGLRLLQKWIADNNLKTQIDVVVYGDAAEDALTDAWVKHRMHKQVEFSRWPGEVAQFDIGLAPFAGTYDEARSNLRLIEYGLCGVPWVASRFGEYTQECKGGLFVGGESAQGWFTLIRDLVMSRANRDSLAAQGREWAQAYRMSRNTKVYEDLLWPT